MKAAKTATASALPPPPVPYERISHASGEALRDIIFDRPSGVAEFSEMYDYTSIHAVNERIEAGRDATVMIVPEPIDQIRVEGVAGNVLRDLLRLGLSDVTPEILRRKDAEGNLSYTVQNVRSIFADGNVGFTARSGMSFKVESATTDGSIRRLVFDPDDVTGESIAVTMNASSTGGQVVRNVLDPSASAKRLFDTYDLELPITFAGAHARRPYRVNVTIANSQPGVEPYSTAERDAIVYIVAAHAIAAFRLLRMLAFIENARSRGISGGAYNQALNVVLLEYQAHRVNRPHLVFDVDIEVTQLGMDKGTHIDDAIRDAAATFIVRTASQRNVHSYDCFRWEQKVRPDPAAVYSPSFMHNMHTRTWFEDPNNTINAKYNECARYGMLLRQHPLIGNPSERYTIEATYDAARVRMLTLYAEETKALLDRFIASTEKKLKPYTRLMRLYTGYLDRAIILYNAPLEFVDDVSAQQWKQATAAPPLPSYVSLDGTPISMPSDPTLPHGLYPELIVSKSSPPADAKTVPPLYEMLAKAAEEVRALLEGEDEFEKWIATVGASQATMTSDSSYITTVMDALVRYMQDGKTTQLNRFIRYFIRSVIDRAIPETMTVSEIKNAVENRDSFVTPGYDLNLGKLPDTFEVQWARDRIAEALFTKGRDFFTAAGITDISLVSRERLSRVFVSNFKGIAENVYDLYVTTNPLIVHYKRLLEIAERFVSEYRNQVQMKTAADLRNWALNVAAPGLEEVFKITELAFQYLTSLAHGPYFGLGPADFAALEAQFVGFALSLHFKEGVQPWFIPAAKKHAALLQRAGAGVPRESKSDGTGKRGGGKDESDDGGVDYYFQDPDGDDMMMGVQTADTPAAVKLAMKKVELDTLRTKRGIANDANSAEQKKKELEQAILQKQYDILLKKEEQRVALQQREDAIRNSKDARENELETWKAQQHREEERSRVEEANARKMLALAQVRFKELELQARADEETRLKDEHVRKMEALDRQAAARRDEELFSDSKHRREMAARRAEERIAEKKRISDEEKKEYEESIRKLKEAADVQKAATAAQKALNDAEKAKRDAVLEDRKHEHELELLQEKRLQASIQHRTALANERSKQAQLDSDERAAKRKADDEAALEKDRLELKKLEENMAKSKLEIAKLQDQAAIREAEEKLRSTTAQAKADAVKLRLREQEETAAEAEAARKRRAAADAAEAERQAAADRIALQEAQNRSARLKAQQAAIDAQTDKELLRLKKEVADARAAEKGVEEEIRKAKAKSDEEIAMLRHEMELQKAGAREKLARVELRRENEVKELNDAIQKGKDTERRILLQTVAVQINSLFLFADAIVRERPALPENASNAQAVLSRVITDKFAERPNGGNIASMDEASLREYIIRSVSVAKATMAAIRAYTASVVSTKLSFFPENLGAIEFGQVDGAMNSILNAAALVDLSTGAEKAARADPNLATAIQRNATSRGVRRVPNPQRPAGAMGE